MLVLLRPLQVQQLTTRSALCNLHISPFDIHSIECQLSLCSEALQVEAFLAVAYAWPVYPERRTGWRGGILCAGLDELLFILDDGKETSDGGPQARRRHDEGVSVVKLEKEEAMMHAELHLFAGRKGDRESRYAWMASTDHRKGRISYWRQPVHVKALLEYPAVQSRNAKRVASRHVPHWPIRQAGRSGRRRRRIRR